MTARGYEIHHGQTRLRADMQTASAQPARELLPGMLWQGGNSAVLGTYLHGLFENAEVIHALFGHDAPSLDQVLSGWRRACSNGLSRSALSACSSCRTDPAGS